MFSERQYFVYMMTNKWNRVLYTGVTNDLVRRVYEHKANVIRGFTKKYGVHKLVYFEVYDDVLEAIRREKQIKSGNRGNKEELVRKMNPWWEDLSEGMR